MKKETLKVWCDEKVEKGKKWFENHKFEAGYVSGILAMLAAYRIVVDKVFEPNRLVFRPCRMRIRIRK